MANNSDNYFDIPILLIVFTRLDTTKKVFDEIKRIRPKRLYIASDGARGNVKDEDKRVDKLRTYLLEGIDWECEVKTKFSTQNLGCKYNPQNAISWFFENEPCGIILEDDCVPSKSFFPFCKILLKKYEADLRVFGITGSNVIEKETTSDFSYYFSEYVQTWGWATWADRWKIHLNLLKNFNDHLDETLVNRKLSNKIANKEIIDRARMAYHENMDAWDYQWFFSAFANNSVFTVPTVNLINNIGHDEDATHTFHTYIADIKAKELDFPLKHPINILPNKEWDNLFYKQHYSWYTTFEKIKNPAYVKAFLHVKLRKIREVIIGKSGSKS